MALFSLAMARGVFMFKTVKRGSKDAFAATRVRYGPFLVGFGFQRVCVYHAEDDGSPRVFEGC
jgi:hypothetical protein